MRSGGHVFVVHGDLTRLACDAWLMPTDARLHVRGTWTSWPPDAPPPPPRHAPTQAWRRGKARVCRLEGVDRKLPQPWLVNVGEGGEVAWFVEGARQFLDRVARDLEATPPKHGRATHLVALPIVGTGQGGAASEAGRVVRGLLPMLRERARAHRLDVALVAIEDDAFAAAQAERSRLETWHDLPRALRDRADALADKALRRDLVLFLGAGVSAASGIPTWRPLLDELACEASLSPRERVDLARLDPADQAFVLKARLEARGRSRNAGQRDRAARALIAQRVRGWHPSLAHFLLAALPIDEVVTTNFDELFEFASRGLGREVSVIPHDLRPHAPRWLLKMHGCVSRPEDLVITREDFLRYEHRRAALAGIVQALLMTKHMLFVGFSLHDENFHRIADSVRRALDRDGARAKRRRFGTLVELIEDPLLEALWGSDLDLVPMGGGMAPKDRAANARRIDLFFDYLLSRTSGVPSHLLNDRFREVLGPGERALRSHLRRFLRQLPPAARHGAAWDEVRALVQRLGGDPTISASAPRRKQASPSRRTARAS